MRIASERMAPLVDRVITEQVGRLAAKLGGSAEIASEPDKPIEAEPKTSAKPIVGR